MKFGVCFSNLLGIKCAKIYSDSFGCEISIVHCVQCLGVYLFTRHNVDSAICTESHY